MIYVAFLRKNLRPLTELFDIVGLTTYLLMWA